MTDRDDLIRSLQLRLEILRNGLGMPYDADAVARVEAQLAAARKEVAHEH